MAPVRATFDRIRPAAGWRTVDERLARIEELLGSDERLDVLGLDGSEQDELPHADAA